MTIAIRVLAPVVLTALIAVILAFLAHHGVHVTASPQTYFHG